MECYQSNFNKKKEAFFSLKYVLTKYLTAVSNIKQRKLPCSV